LEPFIDTVIICTVTALVIVTTGAWQTEGDPEAIGGVTLTSSAYETVLPWFPVVLAIAVVLFGFSTVLAWIYYGMKATGYLFGDNLRVENVIGRYILAPTLRREIAQYREKVRTGEIARIK